MSNFQDILDFWFADEHKNLLFKKDDAFDAAISARFLEDVKAARMGQLDAFKEQADSCLALIILLDQFPRNLFRDSAEAFASDEQALQFTFHGLKEGYQEVLNPRQVSFFLMPLMHSEVMADQQLSLRLFKQYGQPANVEFAQKHLDVIKRFGRFPHRNKALSRQSTPDEQEYVLAGGGF